jgi:Flp pilus assembly protein TadD
MGCGSTTVKLGGGALTPDDLVRAAVLDDSARSAQPVEESEVLALSDEMRSFLVEHVNSKASDQFKLRQLIAAIISSDSFGLTYDTTTSTAAQTFQTRRGNCLSFSSMFVALARHIGLEVQFQEVEIPPDWTRTDGAYILNQHINVLVDLRTAVHAVDFNIADFRTIYDRRLIQDERALAHFYNNKGVELMQAGELLAALANFRKAITVDERSFAPAWANLGILYLRQGHLEYAEASFIQALKVNPEDEMAMSNLAGLYKRMGDLDRARMFDKKVMRHRLRNPYYRSQLARKAIEDGDYDTAVGHLKYAVGKKKNEDRFYHLLGLCHLKMGDEATAQMWLERAQKVAASDALKRKYAGKIDMLLTTAARQK